MLIKKLLGLLIITGLLVSCTKEEAKVAQVPSTVTTTTTPITSVSLQDLLGVWEFNAYRSEISSSGGGGNVPTFHIKTGNNCKLELTNTVILQGGGGLLTHYQGYGLILSGSCSHPSSYLYTFDSNADLINGNYHVDNVTNDSLILSSAASNSMNYYSNNQLSLATTKSINWSVQLASNYPASGQVGIEISHGSLTNPITDIIPIIPSQTFYTGNKIVTNFSTLPHISIKLVNLDTQVSSFNIISVDTRMDIVGTGLSSLSGTHSFCHSTGGGGGGGGGCNGYDNMSIETVALNQVQWD